MAPGVTETVFVTLPDAKDAEDTSSKNYQLVMDTLATVSEQPGCMSIYYGQTFEEKNKILLYINWESYADHETFMKSDKYQPFLEHLKPALGAPIEMYHVEYTDFPPPTVSAPIVETLTSYFPSSIDRSVAEKLSQGLGATLMTFPEGKKPVSIAGGWVLEEAEYETSETGKAIRYGGSAGWKSLDDHVAATKVEEFGKLVAAIREIALPPPKTHLYHATLKEFKKE